MHEAALRAVAICNSRAPGLQRTHPAIRLIFADRSLQTSSGCFGTEFAIRSLVLIAVPSCQGRVSPVFDVAARLVLVEFVKAGEAKRREVVLFQKTPEGIVRNVLELGINLLICGAISRGLQQALQKAGIRVVAGICGEIESILAAYCAGRLASPGFAMPGCWGRNWIVAGRSHRARSPKA